jgi:hypothetical protein
VEVATILIFGAMCLFFVWLLAGAVFETLFTRDRPSRDTGETLRPHQQLLAFVGGLGMIVFSGGVVAQALGFDVRMYGQPIYLWAIAVSGLCTLMMVFGPR